MDQDFFVEPTNNSSVDWRLRGRAVQEFYYPVSQAMLGLVTNSVRHVSYSVEQTTLTLQIYFEGPPNEAEQENWKLAELRMLESLPAGWTFETRAERCDHPQTISHGGLVIFTRNETIGAGMPIHDKLRVLLSGLESELEELNRCGRNVAQIAVLTPDGKEYRKNCQVELSLTQEAKIGFGVSLLLDALGKDGSEIYLELAPSDRLALRNRFGIYLHPESCKLAYCTQDFGDIYEIIEKSKHR